MPRFRTGGGQKSTPDRTKTEWDFYCISIMQEAHSAPASDENSVFPHGRCARLSLHFHHAGGALGTGFG